MEEREKHWMEVQSDGWWGINRPRMTDSVVNQMSWQTGRDANKRYWESLNSSPPLLSTSASYAGGGVDLGTVGIAFMILISLVTLAALPWFVVGDAALVAAVGGTVMLVGTAWLGMTAKKVSGSALLGWMFGIAAAVGGWKLTVYATLATYYNLPRHAITSLLWHWTVMLCELAVRFAAWVFHFAREWPLQTVVFLSALLLIPRLSRWIFKRSRFWRAVMNLCLIAGAIYVVRCTS